VLIVWKGAEAATTALSHWPAGQVTLLVLGVAIGCGLLSALIILPYLYQLLIQEDWRLRWHHYFRGPFLLRRSQFPHKPETLELVPDYYKDHKNKDEFVNPGTQLQDLEANTSTTRNMELRTETQDEIDSRDLASYGKRRRERGSSRKWYQWRNIAAFLKRAVLHGVKLDVVHEQKNNASILCRDLEKKHAKATRFDNNAEHAFSYLQVLTAATAAFANGANDISK
jgi:sodium-dependent phosphate transporter